MASEFKKWPTRIVFSEFARIPETVKIYRKGMEFDQFLYDDDDNNVIWGETSKEKGYITYKINTTRLNLANVSYTGCILANSIYNNTRKVKISLEKIMNNMPEHNRVSMRSISTHLNIINDNHYMMTEQEIYSTDHFGVNTYKFYEFLDDYIEMYPEIYNHEKLNAADIIYYARMKKISNWNDNSFIIYKKQDELAELLKISESHLKAIKKKFADLGLITYKRQDGRGYQEITMIFERAHKTGIATSKREKKIKKTINEQRGARDENAIIVS